MKIEQKILQRIDELLASGEKVLATRHAPPSGVISGDNIDTAAAAQWFASALNLIVRLFGKDSHYYEEIQRFNSEYPYHSEFSSAMGVFRAVKEDYTTGSIFDLRKLVEAEVFDDFLEQGKELCDNGYIGPAAVVGGAVLEDGLRKLCLRESITLPAKPKLDGMNSELAKAGVYQKLTQKKITALADIRNSAAHGQWEDFTKSDVEGLLQWTRDFMETNFV